MRSRNPWVEDSCRHRSHEVAVGQAFDRARYVAAGRGRPDLCRDRPSRRSNRTGALRRADLHGHRDDDPGATVAGTGPTAHTFTRAITCTERIRGLVVDNAV